MRMPRSSRRLERSLPGAGVGVRAARHRAGLASPDGISAVMGLEPAQRTAPNRRPDPDRCAAPEARPHEIVDRLARRFPEVPRRWLVESVRLAYEQYQAATVRAFVPLLVERQVATVLRTRSAASGHPVQLPPTRLGSADR